MKKEKIEISYTVYNTIEDLDQQDKTLLEEARKVTERAYAPYSNFNVGAVARLANGEIITGTNQENASFSAGICAERVLLACAATQYPEIPVKDLAISYHNIKGSSNQPVTPCGVCRQALQESEDRLKHPIRLILAGMEGKVFVFEKASSLLPLAFTTDDLNRKLL